MTCDERLEALLNRCGQTISDLPKSDGKHLTYDRDARSTAEHEVFRFAGQSGYVDVIDCLAMHQDYILHLTDIIDRMETALNNVIGERDYLRKVIEKEVPCLICVTKECRAYDEPCNSCLQPNGGTMVNHEYAGVPEDWSVDDD